MGGRSEEHTSELQSLMRISYDVFCLKKKKKTMKKHKTTPTPTYKISQKRNQTNYTQSNSIIVHTKATNQSLNSILRYDIHTLYTSHYNNSNLINGPYASLPQS